MSCSNVELAIQDNAARITLNRPDKLNCLDDATMVELGRAVEEASAAASVRVLVLTGRGRAFCAGQDLSDPAMRFVDGEPPDVGAIVERHYKPLVLRLQNLHVPTIAAVNGLAAGAGAALALACDLVVAARSAYFMQAFSRIGLTPDTGSTWFLTHKLGTARAIGLTFLAEKLPAETAASWGLIWQAWDDEAFERRLAELVARVAELPTQALVRTRALVAAATSATLEQQLALEASTIRELGWSEDYREGVQAFAEKRRPKFSGR